jgi:Arc/MetJ-type ribon-helix-helix transcriptional regulator
MSRTGRAMMTWYDDIMRTIIDLTDKQIEALKVICARKRISRAEAIRQAVDRLAEEEGADDEALEATLDEVFGSWKHQGIDGAEYQKRLRSEWER